MKKYILNVLFSMIIGILFFSSTNILAADSQNEDAYFKQYQSIIQAMNMSMENAPKSGDPALNYLYQMIPHHEAAIAMSENVLKYGVNQKVKQMAQKIIKDQTKDISKVKELIEKIKANPQIDQTKENAYLNEFMQVHHNMMTAMESIKPTGSVDKDFLLGMMPHHQGAIDMSCSLLKYTDNADVKKLAEDTIKKQTAENKEMSKLLKETK